jgi:hypothetical protein
MRSLLSVVGARMRILTVFQSLAKAIALPREQQLSFGDRLTALPIAALWMLDGSAS